MLVCRLIEGECRLLVDSQHRLFTVSLYVNQVPEVVIKWIRRHLLQRLNTVADVEPELDNVAN